MVMRKILLIRSVLVVVVAAYFVGDSRSSLENAQSLHFSPCLYVWAGGEDRQNSDFLTVIDARPESKSYGQVISTTSVNESGTMPHHTEYEFPKDGVLFANGWAGTRRSFSISEVRLFRESRENSDRCRGYSFLHSMVRLPNGHVLATFQGKGNAYVPTGALVELDEQGQVVRLSSASAPGVKNSLIWPYSLAVLPAVDRVVMSSFVMGFPDWVSLPPGSWSQSKIDSTDTKHLQIWSLSNLKLLATIALPPSPDGNHGLNPSEPRVLADGSVYVGTFNCGLYHLHGLTGGNPSAHFVFAFPGGDLNKTPCGVPVVVGKFWVQTVATLPGLIVLDVKQSRTAQRSFALDLRCQISPPTLASGRPAECEACGYWLDGKLVIARQHRRGHRKSECRQCISRDWPGWSGPGLYAYSRA